MTDEQTPDDVREAVARELEAWDLYDCTRVPGDLTADDFEPVDNEAVADGIIAALSAIPARPTVSAEQMQYAIGYMTMPNRHVMPGTSVVDGWLSALRAAGVVTE